MHSVGSAGRSGKDQAPAQMAVKMLAAEIRWTSWPIVHPSTLKTLKASTTVRLSVLVPTAARYLNTTSNTVKVWRARGAKPNSVLCAWVWPRSVWKHRMKSVLMGWLQDKPPYLCGRRRSDLKRLKNIITLWRTKILIWSVFMCWPDFVYQCLNLFMAMQTVCPACVKKKC